MCISALREQLQQQARAIERKLDRVNGLTRIYTEEYERILEELRSLDQ